MRLSRQYSVSVDTQQGEEREHGILGSKLETGNRRSEQNSAATSVKNKDGTERDRHGYRNCNQKLLKVLTLIQKSSSLL